MPCQRRPEAALLRALGFLIALLLTLSGGAHAQVMERAAMAGLAPGERLRLYALTRALDTRRAPPPITQAARQALQAQGFYHDARRPALLSADARVTPVLAWDANINGGFINDRFDHFGLMFEVDPARMARAGLVAGARLGAETRLAYGPGRYLELQGNGEAVWSPRHEIGRANASLSVCSRNHVTGWNFADLCASTQAGWRALSSSRSSTVSGTLSHLLTAGPAYHQLSLGLARHWQEDGQQNAVTLGWGAVWNHLTTDISLTLTDGIPNETALRRRINAQASWVWKQRPFSLTVWQVDARGGLLLGVERQDRLRGLSLSVRPRRGLTVELTHQQTRSTLALFSEQRTGLGLRFDLGR
jgi:hypothetical protein